MADEISDLRLFTRMVSAGSLSETARRLDSSLPAMSRRLSALEARLGIRLVERGPRRFTLTEEGSLLYDRVVRLLSELDEAEAEATAKAKVPRGHLRVAAPLEIGRRRIAPLVAEFTNRYPEIHVELLLSDAKHDVLGDELDISLHVDLPTDGNVVSRVLLASRRVVCASPDYLSRHPAPLRPADLHLHGCILYVRGRHVIDRWLFQEKGKQIETPVRGTLSTNNAEVIHDWALAGRGVASKAHWDINEDLKAGRLAVVVVQEWWGVNDQIRGVADRLASAGYVALVPDLYRGKSTVEAEEAHHLMTGLNFGDAASQDIRGAVQFLKTRSGKVGVTGFCMGGALALLVLCAVPEVDAAVVWYGCPPLEFIDPAKIHVPLQAHWATQDEFFPIATIDLLQEKLRAAGVSFDFHRYLAHHAFANETAVGPGRIPATQYDPVWSQQAWDRTFSFFGRWLR